MFNRDIIDYLFIIIMERLKYLKKFRNCFNDLFSYY